MPYRWTRVSSGLADLPTDWGEFKKLPSMQDFERGGVTIPAGQRVAFYIHCPHPEDESGSNAIAIRGPFSKGFVQGDVTDQDDFIKIHAGGCTDHPVSFSQLALPPPPARCHLSHQFACVPDPVCKQPPTQHNA